MLTLAIAGRRKRRSGGIYFGWTMMSPPMFIRIRRSALACFALVPLAAAGESRTIVINDGAETYRAVYDDKTAPEADMRRWLLLSPYVLAEGDFEMAKSSSIDASGR